MKLHLLTHATELDRPTNTGRLVAETLAHDVRIVVWQRARPDAELLRRLAHGNIGLVWPAVTDGPAMAVSPSADYVLIDATWQQARKIFNRSPYVQALPRVHLQPAAPSSYRLRRNQIEGGLCTAEAAAELCAAAGRTDDANALRRRLAAFMLERGAGVRGAEPRP